jgi:hypothetical protein
MFSVIYSMNHGVVVAYICTSLALAFIVGWGGGGRGVCYSTHLLYMFFVYIYRMWRHVGGQGGGMSGGVGMSILFSCNFAFFVILVAFFLSCIQLTHVFSYLRFTSKAEIFLSKLGMSYFEILFMHFLIFNG